MKNKKILQTLDDMLFEGKNKAYGAYDLRKKYSTHLTKAFAIGVSVVLFISLSSFLVINSGEKKVKVEPTVVITNLEDWYEPRFELPKEEEITPPVKKEVLRQEVIPEFVEPVEDEKVSKQVDVPTDEQLKDAVIATKKQEGKPSTSVFDNSGEKKQEGSAIKKPEKIVEPVVEKEFLRAEIMPEFEGGVKKMYKWLGNNLRYPSNASNNGVQGRVIVTFIVEKDGQISDVEVLKGIGFGCDEEAKRVINKMPKWKAGMQNGRPVRVRYTIPLNFQIK